MKTKNKVNIYIMNFIDYENFKNNNNKQVLLRVPKGLILVTSEEIVSNPDTVNKMLIQDLNLMENKDEMSESNCKMLNEAVYNKFYDIMVANKRKPSVTRKKKPSQKKPSQKKPSQKKKSKKNKTRNNKK
jgi:hypothetical protein